MADETDVENSLKSLIIGYLYPNGTAQACAAGVPCQVVRGWPTTQFLENAKTQSLSGKPGLVVVSVLTRVGIERNTTRFPLSWQTLTPPSHTLTATVDSSARTISIGGAIAVPQNVVAFVGGSAARRTFVYAVQQSDTLATVAAGLASSIASSFPGTTSSGAVVTVNSNLPIDVRIASSGSVIQEVGRQDKEFQITIWAPPSNLTGKDSDDWRSAVAKIIDPPLRALNRIAMLDGVWARIKFERTVSLDTAQSQGFYRRDLFYMVEYATTITQTAYEIGAAQSQVQVGSTASGDLPLPSDLPTLTTNS